MKNINNATMQSNILEELAAFDVKSKIDFEIYFEDSNEDKEVTIKTENVIGEDNTNSEETNISPPHNLEPKKGIKEVFSETPENDKLNSDKHFEKNNPKEISTLETENLQNRTTRSDDKRKRKQEQLQIYKNKRAKKVLPQENVTNYLSNNVKESDAQKSLFSNPNCNHQDVDSSQLNRVNVTSTATIPSLNKNNEKIGNHQDVDSSQLNRVKVTSTATVPSLNKNNEEIERYEIKSCILSYLTAVSENMRLVMEAYAYHRQYSTPYDSYKKQKMQYFNNSYNTVVKLIMPEAQNKEFILYFLHKTYQHALKRPALNKCCFRDYEVLLKELLSWAKKTQDLSQTTKNTTQAASKRENTVQPTLATSNRCQGPILENPHSKPEVDSTAKSDTICIFSAGFPGNEISINVDPNLSRHPSMSITNNFKNNDASVVQITKKSSEDLPRALSGTQVNNFKNNEASFAQTTKNSSELPRLAQLETQINNKNKCLQELLQQPPQILPCFLDIQNRLYPEMYKYMQTTTCVSKNNLSNNDTIPNQINTRLPQKPLQIQNGHTMIGQSQHLPLQSMPPRQMVLENQQTVNTAHKQSTLARSSYGQLIRPSPPPYVPLMWNQAWQQQGQPELPSFQHIRPQYDQSNHVQQLCHQHHHNNVMPQYVQHQQIQSQIRQSQIIQQQNGQVPMTQSQSIMPRHVNPHIQQPPHVLPECEKLVQIGEWHQGLNELYHQGQTQQQSHKNAPRSISTDSGFISPLNFNTSTDQTVPPVPDHTETSQILITHVTSLNPNVPFMAEGKCVICEKSTKKVCMGCMKIYYCTYECQLLDWPKHGPNCSN